MTTPTDAEIMREAAVVGGLFDDLEIGYQSEDILKFARAVLAKWANRRPWLSCRLLTMLKLRRLKLQRLRLRRLVKIPQPGSW